MGAAVLVAGSRGGIGGAVVAELEGKGVPVAGFDRDEFDITAPGGAESAVEWALSVHGEISGVVHAVGMSGRRLGDGSVLDCSDEAWAQVHRVNLESVFRLLRAAMPALVDRGGGSVVVIGSGLASTLDDDFLTVAYAAAKGALVPLVRSAAFTGARHGVRVNLVSPGVVDTAMARRAITDPELSARLVDLQPLAAGPQTPGSVAATVAWLLGAESAAITGAVVPADGGWTLR
jgi:NAD(P)-dependent dehydrogenase (short-subunit alcohol dehydrogenase family)